MKLIASLFLLPALAQANVAYIGDSQSASTAHLYALLERSMSAVAPIVNARAVCGASIDDYLSRSGVRSRCYYEGITYLDFSKGQARFVPGGGETKQIDALMKKAASVVVQLGDNHLEDPGRVGEKAAAMARRILSAGKRCVWIGPASVAKDECAAGREQKRVVSEEIKRALLHTDVRGRRCIFIDSWAATDAVPPYSGDCVHYADYGPWADAIRAQIVEALR